MVTFFLDICYFFLEKNKQKKQELTHTLMTEEMLLLTMSFWLFYFNSKQHLCLILSYVLL